MDLGSLHFQNPEAFWLLLLVPVLVAWYVYREHRRKSTIKFPALSIAKRAVPSRRVKFRHIVPILRLAALVCFVVALARPQNAMEVEYTSTEGVDIMLALDVSGSMGTLDMLTRMEQAKLGVMNAERILKSGDYWKYSRLGYAQQVIADFIQKRHSDRIGLSARSGWVDEQDHVYIYFSMAEIMDQLQCGHNKAVRLLKELDQGMGLIRRKKQGLGRPDRIYVMNFISGNNKTSDYRNSGSDDTHSDVLFGDFQTSENGNSGVFGTDFGLPHEDFKTSDHGNSGHGTSYIEPSRLPETGNPAFPQAERNDNNINKNYMNDTDPIYPILPTTVEEAADQMDTMDGMDERRKGKFYEQLLRGLWGYLSLTDNHSREELDGIISLGADVMASRQPTVRVGGQEIDSATVSDRLRSLNFTHIDYVLDCIKKTTKPIHNLRSYLLTALYNAPLTIDAYYTNQIGLHEGIA